MDTRVVTPVAPITTVVNGDGRHEVLGIQGATSEREFAWSRPDERHPMSMKSAMKAMPHSI